MVSAPITSGVRVSPAARSAAPIAKYTANAIWNGASHRMKPAARSMVWASSRKMLASGCEKNITGALISSAMPAQSPSETRVTCSASTRSAAPQARATSAVVPAVTAISSACMMKKMRLPVVAAATAGAPSDATIFVSTKPTSEASRFVMIAGQASCQIPRLGPVVRGGTLTVLRRTSIGAGGPARRRS